MNRLKAQSTPIKGVWRVERTAISDVRGSLTRMFCSDELAHWGWTWPIAQVNLARTERRGAVRGMHFQMPPHAEAKLVSCTCGAVWDVALDLRKDSPTFLQWTAHLLSADNCQALLIPPGCAHGFQSLEDGVELLYCHSHPYVPAADSGFSPLDPAFAIAWPEPITLLSDKDRNQQLLSQDFQGLTP